MSAKANTTKIGIFVILAVIIFVLGLLAFGAKSYFTPKTTIETAIQGEVYGLAVGSGVQLRGVPIGKVTKITFSWNLYPQTRSNLIVVLFEIEGNLMPLPKGMTLKSAVSQATDRGLRAIVKSQGITGTSILALERLNPRDFPATPLDYKPRHLYVPSAPPQLTRIVESVAKSLNHLQELDFASIGQEATNTLAAIRDLANRFDQVDLASLSTNANALLVELKTTSTNLNQTIGHAQTLLQGAKIDSLSTNVNGLVAELRETNQRLRTVLDKAGTLPLQQTITDLQQTFRSLNAVLADLKDYPSGFIFGKPPQEVEGLQPVKQ